METESMPGKNDGIVIPETPNFLEGKTVNISVLERPYSALYIGSSNSGQYQCLFFYMCTVCIIMIQ